MDGFDRLVSSGLFCRAYCLVVFERSENYYRPTNPALSLFQFCMYDINFSFSLSVFIFQILRSQVFPKKRASVANLVSDKFGGLGQAEMFQTCSSLIEILCAQLMRKFRCSTRALLGRLTKTKR